MVDPLVRMESGGDAIPSSLVALSLTLPNFLDATNCFPLGRPNPQLCACCSSRIHAYWSPTGGLIVCQGVSCS